MLGIWNAGTRAASTPWAPRFLVPCIVMLCMAPALAAQKDRPIMPGDSIQVRYGVGQAMTGRLLDYDATSVTILWRDEPRTLPRAPGTFLMGRRNGGAAPKWAAGGTLVGAILGAAGGTIGGSRNPGTCVDLRGIECPNDKASGSGATIAAVAVVGAVTGWLVGRKRETWARAPVGDELESRVSLMPTIGDGFGFSGGIRVGGR